MNNWQIVPISHIVPISILAFVCVLGCNNAAIPQAESNVPGDVKPTAESAPIDSTATVNEPSESLKPPPTQAREKPGILDRASDLYNKTKQAGIAGNAAKKWLSETYQDASESGGQTAEETAKWVNDMYKSLKDQGLTTASDAGQWLSDDLRNMNAWSYKVVPIAVNEPEEAEKRMNELGKQGWECFHVSEQESGTVFFFKKSNKSYLKSIPVKDLLRLIPLMGSDNG